MHHESCNDAAHAWVTGFESLKWLIRNFLAVVRTSGPESRPKSAEIFDEQCASRWSRSRSLLKVHWRRGRPENVKQFNSGQSPGNCRRDSRNSTACLAAGCLASHSFKNFSCVLPPKAPTSVAFWQIDSDCVSMLQASGQKLREAKLQAADHTWDAKEVISVSSSSRESLTRWIDPQSSKGIHWHGTLFTELCLADHFMTELWQLMWGSTAHTSLPRSQSKARIWKRPLAKASSRYNHAVNLGLPLNL